MQKQASPAVIAIAVIVLIVVLFVIWKFTLGKKPAPATTTEVAPGVPQGVSPDQYQQQLEQGAQGASSQHR